ncbi:unnamed protein product [Toxocara canis]|uniref:Secreted protein n=1 Tax=Toxocara canis TaxID=6265 RepID=A0A183TXG1_TOXCA|nr:unnamed protein product [Toxocara canis]
MLRLLNLSFYKLLAVVWDNGVFDIDLFAAAIGDASLLVRCERGVDFAVVGVDTVVVGLVGIVSFSTVIKLEGIADDSIVSTSTVVVVT